MLRLILILVFMEFLTYWSRYLGIDITSTAVVQVVLLAAKVINIQIVTSCSSTAPQGDSVTQNAIIYCLQCNPLPAGHSKLSQIPKTLSQFFFAYVLER